MAKIVKSTETIPGVQIMFRNQVNAAFIPKRYEQNRLPSKTIPDQTMTLEQMLLRNTRGIAPTDIKTPIYYGDVDLPEIRSLDLSEQHELLTSVVNRIIQARQPKQHAPQAQNPAPDSSSQDNKKAD